MNHSIDKIMRMTLKDKASGNYNWDEIEYCCKVVRDNTLAEFKKIIKKRKYLEQEFMKEYILDYEDIVKELQKLKEKK